MDSLATVPDSAGEDSEFGREQLGQRIPDGSFYALGPMNALTIRPMAAWPSAPNSGSLQRRTQPFPDCGLPGQGVSADYLA